MHTHTHTRTHTHTHTHTHTPHHRLGAGSSGSTAQQEPSFAFDTKPASDPLREATSASAPLNLESVAARSTGTLAPLCVPLCLKKNSSAVTRSTGKLAPLCVPLCPKTKRSTTTKSTGWCGFFLRTPLPQNKEKHSNKVYRLEQPFRS